jgi:hypothetical protein
MYLVDYPWYELSSPVVDIGGGIGALEMSILKDKRNSHLDFVLFDIPDTIGNAKKVVMSILPFTIRKPNGIFT